MAIGWAYPNPAPDQRAPVGVNMPLVWVCFSVRVGARVRAWVGVKRGLKRGLRATRC